MRILIYSINYFPELTGIGKYTGEMAEWLSGKGCDVKVITAPPYYPAWKVSAGYSKAWYSTEKIHDVSIVRCPLWVPPLPNGLQRIFHLASYAITSFPIVIWTGLRWRPDLIFVLEPPLFCAPGARLAAVLCRAESWLHVQDFEVDAAFELGILKSQRIKKFVEGMERWLMRRFDKVSTISERMIDKLSSKGMTGDKQILLQNWVDLETIRPVEPSRKMREELGIAERMIVVLYSGNMGKKQGLGIIIKGAELLRHHSEILFLLCGDGVARKELEVNSQGIENIKFIDLVPMHRLNELLNIADIHILPQEAGAEDLVMPSKLTNMVASGKPVVATAREGSQVESVVNKCGIVTDPGDVTALTHAIIRLANDRDERQRMGAAGRAIAEKSWGKNNILSRAFAEYTQNHHKAPVEVPDKNQS